MIFREDELELCFVLPLGLAQNPKFAYRASPVIKYLLRYSSNRTRGQKSLDDSALNSVGRDSTSIHSLLSFRVNDAQIKSSYVESFLFPNPLYRQDRLLQ